MDELLAFQFRICFFQTFHNFTIFVQTENYQQQRVKEKLTYYIDYMNQYIYSDQCSKINERMFPILILVLYCVQCNRRKKT
ncbi:hypothetical protein BLOT_009991 [Blomia tropicalis]|nr:hypothetical protein BLOT_009991 [Blomia tropicalis]